VGWPSRGARIQLASIAVTNEALGEDEAREKYGTTPIKIGGVVAEDTAAGVF